MACQEESKGLRKEAESKNDITVFSAGKWLCTDLKIMIWCETLEAQS